MLGESVGIDLNETHPPVKDVELVVAGNAAVLDQ
jgi:hypothetical protein